MRTLLADAVSLGSAAARRWSCSSSCAPTAGRRQPGAADIAVVVHPDVPVDNLSLAELRRILLGDREFWTSGARVTLFIRAPIARERDAVVRDVCQMTEAQFRQHWIGKVFRADTPSGPKIVYSSEMALEQVSRTPGAITFVQGPVTNARSVEGAEDRRPDAGPAGLQRLQIGVVPASGVLTLPAVPAVDQVLLKPRLAAQRLNHGATAICVIAKSCSS